MLVVVEGDGVGGLLDATGGQAPPGQVGQQADEQVAHPDLVVASRDQPASSRRKAPMTPMSWSVSYQWQRHDQPTATTMTSGGNPKPAKAERGGIDSRER